MITRRPIWAAYGLGARSTGSDGRNELSAGPGKGICPCSRADTPSAIPLRARCSNEHMRCSNDAAIERGTCTGKGRGEAGSKSKSRTPRQSAPESWLFPQLAYCSRVAAASSRLEFRSSGCPGVLASEAGIFHLAPSNVASPRGPRTAISLLTTEGNSNSRRRSCQSA